MKGRKLARIGLSGFAPTISGNSLGGFLRSIFAIRICESPEQAPNDYTAQGVRAAPIRKIQRYSRNAMAANATPPMTIPAVS